MKEEDIEKLKKEIENFKQEKEQLKSLLQEIGGGKSNKLNKSIDLMLVILTVFFFIIGFIHIIDTIEAIEIGLLFLSIKIIMMIKKNDKAYHFQFWILNSIEYRINNISLKVDKIEKNLNDKSE